MTGCKPYIGVRGWTHQSQTRDLVLAFDNFRREPTRVLAVIVNVDDITLIEGERRARERCGERNAHARLRPPVEDIAGIFVDHPYICNFISLDAHDMFIWSRMEDIVKRWGPLLHGIELDSTWPPVWIGEFRERHPSLRMILRVTRDAVRAVGPMNAAATPSLVAARAAQYRGVTDVLVNLSGPPEEGGKLFDAELIGRYLRAIRMVAPEVGLVAAGGFGAKDWSLTPLEALLPEFPDLSINAGAALVSVANCIDTSCAIGLYLRAERRFAENKGAVISEARFQASVARHRRS